MNSASYLVYSGFSETRNSQNYNSISFSQKLGMPKMQLYSFLKSNNRKYSFKKPLVVLISESEGEFKIEYPLLELYAFNENKNEAIKELLDDFFDLCDDILPLDDAELGRHPKYWKEELRALVRKNGEN
jgi:predicted restriction endonuclease